MIREKYTKEKKEYAVKFSRTGSESLRRRMLEKTSYRVYHDGKIGISSAIGRYDQDQLEKQAIQALDCGLSIQGPYGIDYPFELSTGKKSISNVIQPCSEKASVFIEKAEKFFKELDEKLSGFSFGALIKKIQNSASLSNDIGLDLNFKGGYYYSDIFFKEKDSPEQFSGYYSSLSGSFDETEMFDFFNFFCEKFQEKVQIKEKTYPVIFFQDYNKVLEKFITDLNGEIFGSGASIFSGKTGEKIMRLLILSIIVLVFTGCDSEDHKSKVYRSKIKFHKPEKLEVLYAEPEETPLEKYYKVHLIDADIAEIELNTERIRKMNADTKKWIMLALQEIKEARVELARRKTEIANIHKQSHLLIKMRRYLY